MFSFAALMNINSLQEVTVMLWAHESLYHRKSASCSLCKLRIKRESKWSPNSTSRIVMDLLISTLISLLRRLVDFAL